MNDRTMGRVAVGLAVLLVLVVALIFVTRGSGASGSPDATPSASTAASAGPTGGDASPRADAGSSPSDGTSPSVSADASASPSGATDPATFTLHDLKLDATDDPAGQARTITFVSQMPGTITVALASKTPQGTTHMCLSQGSKEVGCQDWAKGRFTRTTSQANVTWTVTLIGVGIDTPVVDVSGTFPAATPSVTIEHARFDGTAAPETNGISISISARTAGSLGLKASWDGSFPYELAIENGTTGTTDVSGSTTPVTELDSPSIPIEAGPYRVTLKNTDPGTGMTALTVTIGWP